MKHMVGMVFLSFVALAYNSPMESSARGDDKKDDGKGTLVDFDGLKSHAPAEWKEEKPASQLRYKQFRLPKAKDDASDGELVIFKGFGGSAEQNIKRWKEQFRPPEGKKLDDIATVTELKFTGASASYLDIHGTYLQKAPGDPNAKEERKSEYRMLAVHFQGPKTIYHVKLVGPAKTIEQAKKGFDEWLKGFKE